MHGTRIYNGTAIALSFLLSLSHGFCTSILLVRHALYLFISGVSSFAIGGDINGTKRCFDLYDCSLQLCEGNVTFATKTQGCGDEERDYNARLPGWTHYEYSRIKRDAFRNVLISASVSFLFLFLPFLCLVLERLNVSPLKIKFLSRIFSAVLIVASIGCCVIVPAAIKDIDDFKPLLPDWVNSELETSYVACASLIWIQTISSCLIIVYNQITQIYPNIREFQPLIANGDDDLGWGKIERTDHTPSQDSDS